MMDVEVLADIRGWRWIIRMLQGWLRANILYGDACGLWAIWNYMTVMDHVNVYCDVTAGE